MDYRYFGTDDQAWKEATRPATVLTANSTYWGSGSGTTWYVVNQNLSIPDRITVSGNVHLILADGYTLTAKDGIKLENTNSLTIYGQAQGVGFRYRAYYAAYQLGLTGWVRNCWDETVEMEVQGDEETITEMIKRIRTSSYIEITDAKWTKIPLE